MHACMTSQIQGASQSRVNSLSLCLTFDASDLKFAPYAANLS